ncbi:MAG: hypothetical protein U1F33_14635 [Alphaproteobacteria bacterium]
MRRLIACVAFVLLAFLPAVSFAETPDGTIELSGGSVAIGIGYSWGEGKLVYKGQTYKLKVNGLSIVDVGVSSYTASGSVFRLKKLEDIEGNYTAGTAGATIAGGVSGTVMKNDHGVVIELTATREGLQFTLAPTGMKVTLEK